MVLVSDAYRAVRKIVDEKGADYVYPGAVTDDCMYWDYEENAPSCLVGHYFYEEGFITGSSDAMGIENSTATQACDRLEHLHSWSPVEFSQSTKCFLLALQNRQDAGWAWGKALAFALECADMLTEGVVEDIDTVIHDNIILWHSRGDEPLHDVLEGLD